jgi:glycosyltransferase involved in cell wall biosynthesis
MYLGVPVLASKVYGVPELVVDARTGFLVEANRTAQLAEKLDYVLSAPETQLQEVAYRARRYIRDKHQSSNYAEAYRALFSELTGVTFD